MSESTPTGTTRILIELVPRISVRDEVSGDWTRTGLGEIDRLYAQVFVADVAIDRAGMAPLVSETRYVLDELSRILRGTRTEEFWMTDSDREYVRNDNEWPNRVAHAVCLAVAERRALRGGQ